MWSYVPSEKDMKAVSYCLNKGIHISLLPIKNKFENYYIEIITFDLNMNIKSRKQDPSIYRVYNVIKRVYEYYNYYYDKRK